MEKSLDLLPKEIREKFRGVIPVPVADIANSLGLSVYTTDEFDDSKSGSISKEDGDYVIYINESHPITRQRFTIAHEIGHFILHKDELDKGEKEIIDSAKIEAGINTLERSIDGCNVIEYGANKFAADLLMPEDIFKKIWNESKTLEDVASHFEVSKEAAAVRASYLNKCITAEKNERKKD